MAKDHPTGESGLYSALLELKTPEECYRFLQDVCSYAELSAMEQRYNIAEKLVNKQSYTSIMGNIGASSAIISRVQGAFKFRDGVFGNLFQVFIGHAVFQAALGFHDKRIARGELDSIGIEPQHPRVIGKPDGSDVRHREPLLSRKASIRCSLAEKHYTKWRLRRRSHTPVRA